VLPSTCPFGLCDGSGYYLLPVRVGHPDFGRLKPCDCKQLGETERAKARLTRVLATLEQDMGPELSTATLDSYDLGRAAHASARATMEAALDLCRSYVERPYGWIYLYGPTGVGKSHLLAATARELAQHAQLSVTYASEPDLFRYLREGYARQQEHGDGDRIDADERMSALQKVDVLFLDDLGTAHRGKTQGAAASWADAQLIDLLYQRHLHARYTLLTSNLDVDDLEFRVRSRINGRTSVEYAGRQQKLLIVNADQRKGSEP
jgi:DNA replication protein DnaC